MLTPKQKAGISKNLLRIKAGDFDETHIKEILIDIREFLPSSSLTRELSHFIAHYQRDSGKYWDLLNLRIGALKILLKENKIDKNKIDIDVDFFKVPEKTWHIIFKVGLEFNWKWGEKFGEIPFFVKKENAIPFLKIAYKKVGKFYELQDPKYYLQAGYTAMECLRRFHVSPLIDEGEFIEKINDDLKGFCVRNIPSLNFGNSVRKYGNDITLCIMSLLQSASFKLFNGELAGFKLTTSGKLTKATRQEILDGDAVLTLSGGSITNGIIDGGFPYIDCSVELQQVFVDVTLDEMLNKIPLVYTFRDDNGILKLKPY